MNEQVSKNFGFGQVTRRSNILNDLDLKTKLAFSFLIIVIILGIVSLISNKVLDSKISNSLDRRFDLNKQRDISLENNILSFPKQKDKAQNLLKSHIYFSNVFDFLRKNTLKSVSYKKIIVNSETYNLIIHATTSSFKEVSKQLALIKSIPEVKNFKTDAINSNNEGGVNFSIQIELNNNFFNKL